MDYKTMLLYIPAADFTQPHPALPYLAGYLRAKGENVIIKDTNMECHEYILSTKFLQACYDKVELRFHELNKKECLDLMEQKEYTQCLNSLGINRKVISEIETIKAAFRNGQEFYAYSQYKANVELLEHAFYLISAAYAPMEIKPGEYTSPHFMNSEKDIIEQTQKGVNPFMEYYETELIPCIREEKPDCIGISVVYPTQILQMFAIAGLIKKAFPDIHITIGGAFACRLVLFMPEEKFSVLFQYIDSVILYEGETSLCGLIRYLKEDSANRRLPEHNIIYYDRKKDLVIFPKDEPFYENLDEIPPPDYDGYPLDRYFSPKLVLPYAPTRGCYWNRCAFCHYGSTKRGTAKYREVNTDKIISDLKSLAQKYHTNNFSFTVDVLSPKLALNIAEEIIARKADIRWNADVRAESYFTKERCLTLKAGGCVAVAIGLESANQRVLNLMDKGVALKSAEECIRNFSKAGIATQVMTFLSFPTETVSEAMDTIRFIMENKNSISAFTMGDYELLPGSRVYSDPYSFNIKELRTLKENEFGLLYFFEEANQSKSETEQELIEAAYGRIADQYAGKEFPFVGSVSSNHTLLYFENFGKDILKTVLNHQNTRKHIKQKDFKLSDIPLVNPEKKLLRGKFSACEIHNNLDAGTKNLKESMKKGSYRKDLDRLSEETKIFAKSTCYVLLDDVKWMEVPAQIHHLLRLCNGINTLDEIIKKCAGIYNEKMHQALNNLYSLGILTKQ